MLEECAVAFEKSFEDVDLSEALANYIDSYLSPAHRDMRYKGCEVTAINNDIACMSNDTKARFE